MRSLLPIGVLCLGACQAPDPTTSSLQARPTPPRPAPSLVERAPAGDAGTDSASQEATRDEDSAGTVGWVAGTPILARDLLVEWNDISSQELFLVLERVVTTRLALAEAQRLGLKLVPEEVELRVAEERKRLQEEFVESGTTLTLEEYVRTRLGMKPEAHLARLRIATIRQMIAERVVRRWTLDNQWARVRMIAVSTTEEMETVQAELARGADFAGLAREHSFDDTAENGGLVPFLIRQETSALASAAFATEPGGLAGPLEISGAQVLLLVEELHAPAPGDWTVVGDAVETSLRTHPLSDAEFLGWKLTMEERYPIDVTPLKDLLGIDG